MRINKYIASSGIVGRRKADELISSGNVKLNGKVVKNFGIQIEDGDRVEVNGKLITPSDKKVYYVLNKPKGVITSVSDEKGRITVVDMLEDVEEPVFPVGRLDYDTRGLIILTNDGDFANKILHPKNEIKKRYIAVVSGMLNDKKLRMLRNGIELEGRLTAPAEVRICNGRRGFSEVEIVIHEGRNRQIRKMFAAVDCSVQELTRVSIGSIMLGRLKNGHYRKLRRNEIEAILAEACRHIR